MQTVIQGVQIRTSPLFDSLLNLMCKMEQHSKDFDDGLEAIGLSFLAVADFQNYGYDCTPENSLTFATTGMDGEHFSFLIENEVVDERSPVIFTAPTNYGGPYNVIIAEDFRMFLRLSLRYGGFALGELAYNTKEAMSVFSEPLDNSLKQNATRFDYNLSESKRRSLNYIASELQLQSYVYSALEFEKLQQRYMPKLVMPSDYVED